MNETADARYVTDVIQQFGGAADENVAGKERFDVAHDAPAGGALDPQTRIEHFQSQIAVQVGRRNVLVFGLGAGAKPDFTGREIHILPCAFSNPEFFRRGSWIPFWAAPFNIRRVELFLLASINDSIAAAPFPKRGPSKEKAFAAFVFSKESTGVNVDT
jgi:hypothetical protein